MLIKIWKKPHKQKKKSPKKRTNGTKKAKKPPQNNNKKTPQKNPKEKSQAAFYFHNWVCLFKGNNQGTNNMYIRGWPLCSKIKRKKKKKEFTEK